VALRPQKSPPQSAVISDGVDSVSSVIAWSKQSIVMHDEELWNVADFGGY